MSFISIWDLCACILCVHVVCVYGVHLVCLCASVWGRARKEVAFVVLGYSIGTCKMAFIYLHGYYSLVFHLHPFQEKNMQFILLKMSIVGSYILILLTFYILAISSLNNQSISEGKKTCQTTASTYTCFYLYFINKLMSLSWYLHLCNNLGYDVKQTPTS